MRPKVELDPEFLSRPKPKSRYLAVRSLGRLMTLIALSGLVLAAYAGRPRLRSAGPSAKRFMPVPKTPGMSQPLPVPPSSDRSIIVAPPGVDEAMIITADAGVDEAMIVTPERLRTRALGTPPMLPLPDGGQAPPGSWPLAPPTPRP